MTATDWNSAWEEYRRRRARFFAVWFGGIPCAVLFAYFLVWLTKTAFLGWVGLAIWPVLFVLAAVDLYTFPCPRCGQPFFSTKWIGNNQFRRTCGWCGLPKWTSNKPVQPTRATQPIGQREPSHFGPRG